MQRVIILQRHTKICTVILFILIFIIGVCVGVIVTNITIYPPAYPCVGDWNGDGVLNASDFIAAIDELFNGTKYPEIIYQ
jgi:hypothetical protein